MTDPQTQQEALDAMRYLSPMEITAQMPDGIHLVNAQQDLQNYDGLSLGVEAMRAHMIKNRNAMLGPSIKQMEKLMEEERTGTKPMIDTTPPKRIGLHRLFNRDSQIPLNGVWFRVDVVEEEKLVLVPTHFTKKFSKRDR